MGNVILNQNIQLNAVLVLICATAYSKTDDNRWYEQTKLCQIKYFKHLFYIFYIFYHIILN